MKSLNSISYHFFLIVTPWNFNPKNKLYRCTVKVKVTQSCPALCNPMDNSPWNSPSQNTGVGSLPYSRRSSQSGIKPRSPTMQVASLPAEPQGKPQMYCRYLRYFCPPQIPAFNPIEKTSLYLLKTQCNTLAT